MACASSIRSDRRSSTAGRVIKPHDMGESALLAKPEQVQACPAAAAAAAAGRGGGGEALTISIYSIVPRPVAECTAVHPRTAAGSSHAPQHATLYASSRVSPPPSAPPPPNARCIASTTRRGPKYASRRSPERAAETTLRSGAASSISLASSSVLRSKSPLFTVPAATSTSAGAAANESSRGMEPAGSASRASSAHARVCSARSRSATVSTISSSAAMGCLAC